MGSALSVSIETRLLRSRPKTYHSPFPTPVMLQIKFDCVWFAGLSDIQA